MPNQQHEAQSRLLVHPLSYVRRERGWSQQDVANIVTRRLNTANRREKVWRWERWGVIPDADTQLALAAEIGVPPERVHSMGWPHWLPAGERIDISLPWTTKNGLVVLDQAAGKAVLDRRGFMILAAGSATELARGWLDADRQAVAQAAQGAQVDVKIVRLLEQRIPGLRSMDYAMGGESVRAVVDADLALVTHILKRGSYTEALGKRLFAVAAELGRIAGWASFDAGYHAAAERYWVAGLRAAHASGDRSLGANILKSMSLQRVDTQKAREALELSEAALQGARSAPARVRAMLSTREARTHAFLSDTHSCEKLLIAADTAMGKADDQRSPSWAAYFDKPEYCAQVAACYLLLSSYEKADEWLEKALKSQPAERRRDRATYMIWQADAADNLGDLDRACDLVSRAVADVVGAPSERNRSRLVGITRQLSIHKTPTTVALDEQVRAAIAA
jgi:tetratricopeptide (TPR) repeat protein